MQISYIQYTEMTDCFVNVTIYVCSEQCGLVGGAKGGWAHFNGWSKWNGVNIGLCLIPAILIRIPSYSSSHQPPLVQIKRLIAENLLS